MFDRSDILTPLLDSLTGNTPLDICGLHGSSAGLFISRLVRKRVATVLCIVPTDELLDPLARDIELFAPEEVLTYPSFEIPPYTPLSPDPATVASRLATLHRLLNSRGPRVVVTSAEALLRRVVPKSMLSSRSELLMVGEEVDREALVQSLIASGYETCALVQQVGDLSIRGSIIDIYSPAAEAALQGPLRLDFFGDTVESIRIFDPITQRSLKELQEAIVLPGSDILFPVREALPRWRESLRSRIEHYQWPERAAATILEQLREQLRFAGIEFFLPLIYSEPESPQSLFDYLGPSPVVVQLDPAAIRLQMNVVRERIQANYEEALASAAAALPPQALFLSSEELTERLSRYEAVNICALPEPEATRPYIEVQSGGHGLLKQEIELQRRKRGVLAPLADRVIEWLEHGETIILACHTSRQAQHLQEMLERFQIRTTQTSAPLDFSALPGGETVLLVEHPLAHGFDLVGEKLHLLSASELFGEKRLRPVSHKGKGRAEGEPILIESLNVGDIVVHRDHGLAVYQGLVNMAFAGQQGDFMQLEYQNNDKLYVPIDRIHWVSRYQGLTDQQPRLDRLGAERWQSAKKKVTDAVWQVAQELIEIYARRAMQKGRRFSPPGELYQELEESFPYEETSGQLQAITETLGNLMSEQPMDRLVCGDVGYGKTEVAVRAAFKVIEDGFQVAILVPTTVLAEQHAATFRDRFASFPVRVACINRFRTPAEQKKIIADLAEGRIDLVVGTHRLLSKDVTFRKLGLLIIDEEHRFGVAHKEKLKKLRAEVDVLTLTATPIPRTLQMSLLGIRDLSVISTAPRLRRAVKTFLARHEDLVIREAIIRELQRGGQLYFVHNRVNSIHRIAETIEKLVPQARIAVAHGQMSGSHLEEIMIKFINHEVDVLVCTTIIESGLDIPNANTIIINRADQLGLADIYQLRGRVGRASRQAYAYLLVPSIDSLTDDAKERLRALMDCNELGGGFKLAMNDLQIRGGGNLLGVSQSGHIAAVGYDLYLELLQSTVADLQKKARQDGASAEPDLDPEIKLKVVAFLPDNYVADSTQRYHLYRRISLAGSNSPEALDDLQAEVIDRFGPLPSEADTFFRVIALKYHLRLLGIDKLEQGPDSVIFSFVENSPVAAEKILALIGADKGKKKKPMRLTPDRRLIVPLEATQTLFVVISYILHALKPE